jgi:hypothetical protein
MVTGLTDTSIARAKRLSQCQQSPDDLTLYCPHATRLALYSARLMILAELAFSDPNI